MTAAVKCAWCNATIRDAGAGAERASHGICFACVQAMGLFPTEDIRSLSPEQLDDLPLGVVELDPSCTVTRYNRTEARASGLMVGDVIGRHFFDQIAPCTSVQEFRGRAEEMMRSSHALREELDFVFHFKTGSRYAHIVFVWDPGSQRLTILVDLMGDEADHAQRCADRWSATR